MKILVLHKRYQIAGGEDAVVGQEVELLRARGFSVETLIVDNDDLITPLAKVQAALEASYSHSMRRRVGRLLEDFQPDILHVHNFFPRLTPSIYDAARDLRCPVVQTLHNYRLLCLNGTLFRDGGVCLDCTRAALPWPGVQHRCYRSSLAGSAAVALMLATNRLRGAWTRRVDRFLALTPFARDLLLAHTGIAPGKMRLKPNAARDLGRGTGSGGYALFVGRLSAEKGISVLLQAAELGCGLPIRVAGRGPLEGVVAAAHASGLVEYLGPQGTAEVARLMQNATVLLVPSLWYEGLPMVIPEAFSTGLPVIASDLGSLSSLIEPEKTGMLVPPGDASALAAACRQFQVRQRTEPMRVLARTCYERSYLPEANCELLAAIYRELLAERACGPGAGLRGPVSSAASAL